jgi:hypothetical protein
MAADNYDYDDDDVDYNNINIDINILRKMHLVQHSKKSSA